MRNDTEEPVPRGSKKRERAPKALAGNQQLLTLEVSIVSGPMTERFSRKNPVVARTIEIRGDQTLAVLHRAIFDAFDREEEHMYEFQIGGRGPMDPKARRYVVSMGMDDPFAGTTPAGDVARTRIGSLGLEAGEAFGYWFDFGDDWWHRIAVLPIDAGAPRGKFPKVTRRVGQSPPQYVDWDEEA